MHRPRAFVFGDQPIETIDADAVNALAGSPADSATVVDALAAAIGTAGAR